MQSRWHRGTRADRVRRLLLITTVILLTGLGGAMAGLIHHRVTHDVAHERAASHPVTAVVVSAPNPAQQGAGWVPYGVVRYRTPGGSTRQAEIPLGSGVKVGDRVALWVDHGGQLTAAPSSASPLHRSASWLTCVAVGAAAAYAVLALLSAWWVRRRNRRLFEEITSTLHAEETRWERELLR